MATDILGDAPTEGEVDVPAVAGATLEKVKNFLALRVAGPMGEIKKPLRDKTDLTKSGLTEAFAAWATALSSDDAFELIRAGDFLKIEDLTNIAAARIAQVYLRECRLLRLQAAGAPPHPPACHALPRSHAPAAVGHRLPSYRHPRLPPPPCCRCRCRVHGPPEGRHLPAPRPGEVHARLRQGPARAVPLGGQGARVRGGDPEGEWGGHWQAGGEGGGG